MAGGRSRLVDGAKPPAEAVAFDSRFQSLGTRRMGCSVYLRSARDPRGKIADFVPCTIRRLRDFGVVMWANVSIMRVVATKEYEMYKSDKATFQSM
jgi:hypothetical protein